MLEPSACRFWQASLQSGLTDAQALQPCWDAVAAEKRTPEHIDRRLARQAVQAGVVTVWQAQQLLAGRSTGFKIDRYVLLQLIGQGGMGRVYLARDTKLNRRVALKILSPERVNNPRAIARFHREAMVGAQLQHENLVRIYDEGEAAGKCYLVMEYIEGKNIGQMIGEAGPLPPSDAARLVRQVALGLEHAQRKGLIHRDVNPYNILVTHDGIAKLTDLGLAIDLSDNDRVTRDGATVGTFDYVSPEQARHSHSVDTRSDIYSLGCTLYHMLTGQVPFPSVGLAEKLFGHQLSEPEPVRNLSPAVPEGLAAVVARTMKKAADDRYSTPLELAQALEPFADDGTAGAEYPANSTPQVARRVGGEASITRQIDTPASVTAPPPTPTPTPTPAATPTSSPTADDSFDLGINLVAPAVARPSPVATAPVPRPKALADEAPVADDPLGLRINLGPAEPPKAVPAPEPAPAAPPGLNVEPTVGEGLDEGLLGIGLGVNLGPEPPLSKAPAQARSKAKAKAKAPIPPVETRGTSPAPGSRPPWLMPAAAVAGVLVLAVGAALAYRQFGGPAVKADTANAARPKPSADTAKPIAGERPKQVAKSGLPEPRGKEVRVVAGDRSESNEPDLKSAIRAAIGARGHVELRGSEPLKVSAAEALKASGGVLVIRAAAGVRPVLQVEVKGSTPFLSTRTDTALRIEGVTIEATYVDPGNNPAAVIEAGGSVTLDRCAFRVVNPTAKSRAVAAESGAASAAGCWFENFDRALDVAFFGGATCSMRHCMIIRSSADDKASGGSAVRLRSMPGGFAKTGRKLVLERCTVRGKGFLEFAGFSRDAPVSINLIGNAVVTDILISWEPGATADPRTKDASPFSREALAWSGRDDAYDVHGATGWVHLVASKGDAPTPLPNGPNDLVSWIKTVGDELDPVPPPVSFATDHSERPEPSTFAVTTRTVRPLGADPALVGPGAKPLASAVRP